MPKLGLFLTGLMLLTAACTPTPNPPTDFESRINAQITPTQATVPDEQDNPQTVVACRDENGVQTDFLEALVLLQPESDAQLQQFLDTYGGTVVDDNTIPEPPAELGITLTDEQRQPTQFVVRITLASVDATGANADARAAGLTGVLEFSSAAGLQTFAGIMDAKAAGYSAVANRIEYGFEFVPLGQFELLFNTQERSTGAGAFLDAFTEPRFGSGANTSNSNVALAWQFVSAHGYQRRTRVAIIDGGFWLDLAGRAQIDPMLGNDTDFPAPPAIPLQYDFNADDAIAAGPSPMLCTGGSSCFWHGTGAASVATGILDNQLGAGGTGGGVADPMLFKRGPSSDDRDRAVRTAIAWGADVVSMSFGSDCDAWCRMDNRGEGSISDMIESATNVVFVASAGNNGKDVSVDTFVHPCTIAHVTCVGALNDPAMNPTTRWQFSNFGSRVAIFAPQNIPVMAQPAANDRNPGGPAAATTFGATSAATPFVAGVAAMMKALNPNLTGDDVSRILVETAQPGGDATVTRIIDAFAAVRRAAEGVANVPDRFEPNNGPGAPTSLGATPPYSQQTLSISATDVDYYTFTSPGAVPMIVNLTYPIGLGHLSVINVQSLGESCGTPTLVKSAPATSGWTVTYNVPAGAIQLAVRADAFNAYNLDISFGVSSVTADAYEAAGGNDTFATAPFIHSTPEIGGRVDLTIDPMVTVEGTIHSNLPADVDYYIVRGARLSNNNVALFGGAPFVSVYANTAPINLTVYERTGFGGQGALVGTRSAVSCATDISVKLQADKYYAVKVDGGLGQYTLFNGAIADPTVLPPQDIIPWDFDIADIVKPGPVEIERRLLFTDLLLFEADPGFEALVQRNPYVHLSLFDFTAGDVVAEGVAAGAGERLLLEDLQPAAPYALFAEPTIDVGQAPPTLHLVWDEKAAARVSDNLIINGDAETLDSPDPDQIIPYWDISYSTPLAILYGADTTGFPGLTDPGPEDRGLYLFAGGVDTTSSGLQQVVAVDPDWRAAIDAGRVQFNFTAYLGGVESDPDYAAARLTFRRSDDSVIESASPSSVTAVERGDVTALLPVEVHGQLPEETASILVEIYFVGGSDNYNDGYADNLELILSEY